MGEVLGRLHPLIVHLPVGMLALAFLMELVSRRKAYAHLKSSISFVLLMTLISAVFALFTGWVMPKAGDFNEQLVGYHFWSSVSLTIAILGTYLCQKSTAQNISKYYQPLLYVSMILLAVAGHFGGSLTHGADHLTKPINGNQMTQVVDANSLKAYSDIIEPIFKQKCYSCHNEGKQKGGFIMSTEAGLMKGGKEGIAIVTGKPSESSLMERMHLPLDDEAHMPPEGKKQLTQNEMKLIEWWIATGPSFNKLVGALAQTDDIREILKTYEHLDHMPNPTNLQPIEKQDIEQFRSSGIAISGINESSPFVYASLSRDTNITNQQLKQLSKFADHIIELDLSHSNVSDNMLKRISKFKNLTNLKLQNTDITSKGIRHLESLKYLNQLNLYGTQVNDEALSSLDKMKALKKLFLWQTQMSTEAVSEFAERHSLIDISHNVDTSIFGDARLKPPIISADRDIFSDSLAVTLSLNFANVKVLYSIDGSEPDTTSLLYKGPFNIYETSKVKAISYKEGWVTSEANEQVYTQVGHEIVSIKLDKPPSDKYRAKGGKSLIDFVKGTESFVDGNWLGYEGKHMKAKLDLGSVKPIKNIVVGALEATGSYIFYPKAIHVYSSIDGKAFDLKASLSIPIAKGPHPNELKSFLVNLESHEARHVEVEILGTLKNPEWHPAPGASNWIFIDEIMVN